MRDRTREFGEAAWAALHALVRSILARKPGAHLIEGRLTEIDLTLALSRDGRPADAASFAASLEAAIESRIDAAIEEEAAFLPGHAFCHRCDAAACAHSRPPTNRHVFLGYGATGAPLWMEFAQYGLDARLPEFDRLYGDPPALITALRERDDLHAEVVVPFRASGRELLGELVAGFFTLPSRPGEGRVVLALTFQAVARTDPGGSRRIGLNVLGTAPDGGDLGLVWERQADLPWRRAVRWAQAALQSIGRERALRRPPAGGPLPADAALVRRVNGVLQGLARRLAQDRRGHDRRTAHADERHAGGERPTRKALDDIKEARPEAFLRDERKGTVVVLGARGRTHFFTEEGRLVSSVRYSREAIERKRRQGFWRALPPADAQRARETLLRGAEAASLSD